MAGIIRYLSTGICLATAISSIAQTAPGKPTAGKVIGKSLHDQKKWELKQLPRNSVLYQYQSATAPVDPVPYSFKKEKLPVLNLPAPPTLTAHQPNIYLQSYLKEQRRQELPRKKKYWWSDTGINSSHKIFPDSKNN